MTSSNFKWLQLQDILVNFKQFQAVLSSSKQFQSVSVHFANAMDPFGSVQNCKHRKIPKDTERYRKINFPFNKTSSGLFMGPYQNGRMINRFGKVPEV